MNSKVSTDTSGLTAMYVLIRTSTLSIAPHSVGKNRFRPPRLTGKELWTWLDEQIKGIWITTQMIYSIFRNPWKTQDLSFESKSLAVRDATNRGRKDPNVRIRALDDVRRHRDHTRAINYKLLKSLSVYRCAHIKCKSQNQNKVPIYCELMVVRPNAAPFYHPYRTIMPCLTSPHSQLGHR